MKNLKQIIAPFIDFIIIAIIALTLTWFFSSCGSMEPAARYQKTHSDKMFDGYKKLR